jgi:hypothetical protein
MFLARQLAATQLSIYVAQYAPIAESNGSA